MQTVNSSQIRPHMPVVGPNDDQFATVDHLDASDTIKLTMDEQGQHHWIPLSWVTRIDDKVHVDRPDKQAVREWSSKAPEGAQPAGARPS